MASALPGHDPLLDLGDGVRLDVVAHALRRGDREVLLTPTECALLARLAETPSLIVRRSALIAAGWPVGAIVHDNTLDVYIARLRRKLRAISPDRRIRTDRGVGYALQVPTVARTLRSEGAQSPSA